MYYLQNTIKCQAVKKGMPVWIPFLCKTKKKNWKSFCCRWDVRGKPQLRQHINHLLHTGEGFSVTRAKITQIRKGEQMSINNSNKLSKVLEAVTSKVLLGLSKEVKHSLHFSQSDWRRLNRRRICPGSQEVGAYLQCSYDAKGPWCREPHMHTHLLLESKF